MSADPVAAVLDHLASVRGPQEDFYRDLHAHPELPHQEHRTAGGRRRPAARAGCEVHEGIGGTGVVGMLRNGDGPTVLLRADMDALPVREETGLAYASTRDRRDGDGTGPVMHACGHDVHVTCLLGAAALMARAPRAVVRARSSRCSSRPRRPPTAPGRWSSDGLAALVGDVDVAMAQHVLPMPGRHASAHAPGPTLSAADSMRITVHGRGAHGSMPQAAVDPVVLAAMIVVRLQTVVAREVAPGDTAVLTVGSIQAGTKSNVIPDHAVLQLNVRTYDERTRATRAGRDRADRRAPSAQASGSPQEPEFELFDRYPLTDNDAERRPTGSPAAFADVLRRPGRRAAAAERERGLQRHPARRSARPTPTGASAASTPTPTGAAEQPGRVAQDIPVNHSAALRAGHPAHAGHRHPGARGRSARLAQLKEPSCSRCTSSAMSMKTPGVVQVGDDDGDPLRCGPAARIRPHHRAGGDRSRAGRWARRRAAGSGAWRGRGPPRPAAADRRRARRGGGWRGRRGRPGRAAAGPAARAPWPGCGSAAAGRRRSPRRRGSGSARRTGRRSHTVAAERDPGVLVQPGDVLAVDGTVPASGRSSPLMQLSSVVFPEPERPTTAATEPRGTSSRTPLSACTSWAPVRYLRCTPSTDTIRSLAITPPPECLRPPAPALRRVRRPPVGRATPRCGRPRARAGPAAASPESR